MIGFFEGEHLKYEANYEHNVVMAGFGGMNVRIQALFNIDEDQGLSKMLRTVPMPVPEGCRTAIAEAITRANYGMKVGKFELDLSDGDLRYHVCNAFPRDGFDEEIVRRLLGRRDSHA